MYVIDFFITDFKHNLVSKKQLILNIVDEFSNSSCSKSSGYGLEVGLVSTRRLHLSFWKIVPPLLEEAPSPIRFSDLTLSDFFPCFYLKILVHFYLIVTPIAI